jgi:hypothetical protein
MDVVKNIKDVLMAYNTGYPFQSRDEALEMAELFRRFSPAHRKYGDVFDVIEVAGGWGVSQDVKH